VIDTIGTCSVVCQGISVSRSRDSEGTFSVIETRMWSEFGAPSAADY